MLNEILIPCCPAFSTSTTPVLSSEFCQRGSLVRLLFRDRSGVPALHGLLRVDRPHGRSRRRRDYRRPRGPEKIRRGIIPRAIYAGTCVRVVVRLRAWMFEKRIATGKRPRKEPDEQHDEKPFRDALHVPSTPRRNYRRLGEHCQPLYVYIVCPRAASSV